MIDPSTIDLNSLPSVPLEKKNELPEISGIYFAINSLGAVQYIGRSRNINQRWQNHRRLHELKKSKIPIKIGWLKIDSLDLLPATEKLLIQYFNPPVNDWREHKTKAKKFKGIGIVVRKIKEIEVDSLGERIKAARLASNKSLEKICGEVGVSKTYWYDLEKDRIKGCLSIENLKAIEEALETDFGVTFND